MKKAVSVIVIVIILLTSLYIVYAEDGDSETEVTVETEQADNSEQIATEPDEPSEGAEKEAEVPDDTPENPEQKQSADVVQPIEVDSISTPRVEAGERVSFSIGFHAKETYRIKSIAIVTSVDMSVFPFELEKTSYLEKYDNVVEATYTVDLCARKEAEKGYYNLLFEVVYEDDGQEKCISFPIPVFVNQEDKEPEEKEPEKENPVAVPKVILTASRTEPEEIIAGEPFNLILTFKNTSSSYSVSSLKISLAPEGKFTPQTGSANMFTSRLYAGQSKELSIELIPGSDLSPGYYMINMNLSYDTITGSQVISATQAETVSLKVNQIPSVRITDMEISPESITVGKEINFAFDLLNTGRSAIYNATVKIFCEGGFFKDSEVFLGNIDPGKAGIVDSYVTALLSGNAKVNLTVSYEDADGKVYTYENVKECYIGPRPSSESDIPVPQEETGDLPIAAIIMSVVSAGIIIYLLFVKKKKEKMPAYDDSFIDRIEEGKNESKP